MAVAPYISHFTQSEIRTIFKKARRVLRDPGLDVLLYPTKSPFGRILVITSRKVGNAPTRNKVRRRLKAIFYKDELFKQNIDCFVIVKKPGVAYTSEQLQKLIHHAFSLYQHNTQ